MQNGILCGSYRVFEQTEFTNSSYECAAWWRTINVGPGDYPVYAHAWGSSVELCARLSGSIVGDNFQSLWGGVAIGEPYDGKQNAGKPATHTLHWRDYDVFASMHRDGERSPWKSNLSTIPYELDACSDCGGIIRKNPSSTRCPRCSVERQAAAREHVRRRHRFILASGYGLRTTRDSSYLDSVIVGASYDQGNMRDFYANILRAEIAALRSAGPRGRIAARERYPVPAFVFSVG